MLKMVYDLLKVRFTSNKGQGMVEYGLIISLIAVAAIAGLVAIGPKLLAMFTAVSDKL